MVKWLRIIRIHTLPASLCPVMTALAVMGKDMPLQWEVAVCTLLCAVSLQILSNLINDYYDYLRGADQQGRVGFRRALAEGDVTITQMRTACIITLGIAVALGAYLVWKGGIPILVIGLLAILFAWLYTATSHSLSYLGIADIFVLLFYGIVAGWGTAYLQVGTIHFPVRNVLCATAINGLISMCILMINNIRDIDEDRLVGKKTIPVRFGKTTAFMLMGLYVVLMPFLSWMAFPDFIPMLVLLPAAYMFYRTLRASGAEYNTCLILASVTNICYTLLVICSIV